MPEISRIIAPCSLNTENEERIFNTIKEISTKTSSRKAEHVRDNAIIRMQAEQNFKEKYGTNRKSTVATEVSKVSKLMNGM